MKITKIEQFFPQMRTRLVKITTDEGVVGWGEATLEGKPQSTIGAIEDLSDLLIGKDALRIEFNWQNMYRTSYYRGGNVLMSAISGVDQALWDIAGKFYGVPVHSLLGGAVRDRIRMYAHWGIVDTSEAEQEKARAHLDELRTKGYTAYKSGIGGKWRGHEPPAVIDAFVQRAYLMREWLGPDVEIAFDFHGKMTPALAVEVCNEIKGMRPMFVEEPVPQENVDALKWVTDHVPFPIATGERLLSRWEFRELFEKQAVSYVQPDSSHAGGITELKKIANMAEVYYTHVMPHCALGPLALAACTHVDAVIPNFLMQETVAPNWLADVVVDPWPVTDGYMALPTKPGLGLEIDETEVKKRHRCTTDRYTEELGGEFLFDQDGSIADW